MRMTVQLRSAGEVERLHTAAYRFAETRPNGLRPHIITDCEGAVPLAHILLESEEALRAFRSFWSGYRNRRLDLAA